ncbi:MAG: peptidase M24 family protein [Ilumatobacter coccineus]|uniref:Peptidase M24 family protein n=1 Tax=Ilumatobacter coccineus TaxID=467094 RepID=A0A2G6KE52_9ACTN|nr:MAG: peptidase M24 family protein [Ilumatobacter coccineus]
MSDLLPLLAAGRADVLRAVMAESGCDGVLVIDPVDARWLTGFGGSNARVAVTPDDIVVVTDGRYRDRAVVELTAAGVEATIVVRSTRDEQIAAVVEAMKGCRQVGMSAGTTSHAEWIELARDLPLKAGDDAIASVRRAKNDAEIQRMAIAAAAADAALAECAPLMGTGVTEADIRDELEYRMRCHGADGAGYDTIVASGPEHAARPHHEVSRRVIIEGDTVVIDVGASVDGYRSDMTRSYVIGDPTPQQAEIYDLVAQSQQAGLDRLAAGVACVDIDQACREVCERAGYSDWYLHSAGHGVGLRIHEEPFLSPTSHAIVRAGDVVTVEPGLYRGGFGGFRIEDLVVVSDTGLRVLTSSPKDTPCLPSPPTI